LPTLRERPRFGTCFLSGGDPLTLSDESLAWLLSRLRQIRHVEFPEDWNQGAGGPSTENHPGSDPGAEKFHPLWMSIHFTHPEELTPEVSQACERLADAGIPLGSQTVLLSGINDDVPTMKALVHGLLK